MAALRLYLGLLFFGAAGTSSAALTDFKVSLEWFWNPDHLPLLVAQKRGLFEEHGLKVEVVEPDDHFEPVGALTRGDLDAAVTETIHLSQDRFKLGPGKIMGFNRFLHTLGGVMYAKNSKLNITRPRDMCQPGKQLRIQYPGAPGPGGIAIVKTMVDFDGGNCDQTDIVSVNNGFYHTKALLEDKADVATLIFANFELPEARSSKLEVDFFDLKKFGVPDFCQLVLIASPSALAGQGAKFRGFNRALRDAVDWIKLHPSSAKEMWLEAFPPEDSAAKTMMQEILDLTLYMFPSQQDISESYWRNLEQWLLESGQVEQISGNGPIDYWSNDLAFEQRPKGSGAAAEKGAEL